MWRFALGLGYLSSVLLVSPCLGAEPAGTKRKAREITLPELVERLKAKGEDTPFPAVLVKLMKFPADSTKKTFEAPASEATDSVSRLAQVVFSKSGDSGDPIATGLYWSTTLRVDRRSEGYDYHTALDGSLVKAVRLDGEIGENGRAIRGATKATALDVQADEVRDRFQREVLDFWLRGKGRKKAGGKATPAK